MSLIVNISTQKIAYNVFNYAAPKLLKDLREK